MGRTSRFLAFVAICWVCAGTMFPEVVDGPPARLAVTLLGPTPVVDDLRSLCDEIGGRVTGTPACERAVRWAAERFRAAGIEEVRTESFPMPLVWEEISARAELTAPDRLPVKVVAMGFSPSTPKGGIAAPVVDIGSGTTEDFRRVGRKSRGAVLLLRSDELVSLEKLFQEYIRLPEIIDRAVEAEAAAILEMSTRTRHVLYRHIAGFGAGLAPLPIGIASREDSLRLVRLLKEGRDPRIRLDLVSNAREGYQARNVIAEIPGREKPREVVLLGVHLDSWALGTGAQDNGCNVAMVIDVARAIAGLDRPPRRTIRFVLFTGEEQGLWGSLGYVRSHREELDRHVAAVIVDLGSGKIDGFSLGGRADLTEAVRETLDQLEELGPLSLTTDAFVGTDNFDFLLEGVPNLVANQEPALYLPDYHASSDTFDKVDLEALKQNAAVVAGLVYGIADRPEPLGPRQTRPQVSELLSETGVDKQLRVFGIWNDWQSGRRGRTE